MMVMDDLPHVFDALTKSEFKLLIGYPRPCGGISAIRAFTKRTQDMPLSTWMPARQPSSQNWDSLHCIMCDEDFKVARIPCDQEECPGNVFGNNAEDYDGYLPYLAANANARTIASGLPPSIR
jgi:hypothetical protein